jgi:hypothetical protein
MKKFALAAALLLGGTAIALAAEQANPNDLPAGAKEKMPGTTSGGTTAHPTAEPKSGTLSDTAKEATDSGANSSTSPTAKPKTGDIPEAAKKTTE